jgi:hypothetical protein
MEKNKGKKRGVWLKAAIAIVVVAAIGVVAVYGTQSGGWFAGDSSNIQGLTKAIDQVKSNYEKSGYNQGLENSLKILMEKLKKGEAGDTVAYKKLEMGRWSLGFENEHPNSFGKDKVVKWLTISKNDLETDAVISGYSFITLSNSETIKNYSLSDNAFAPDETVMAILGFDKPIRSAEFLMPLGLKKGDLKVYSIGGLGGQGILIPRAFTFDGYVLSVAPIGADTVQALLFTTKGSDAMRAGDFYVIGLTDANNELMFPAADGSI